MKIIKFYFNQTWHRHAHLSMQFGVILCSHLWIFDHLCYLLITIGNIIYYIYCHKGKLFVWYWDAVFVTTVRATGYHCVNVRSWRPADCEQLIRSYKINDTWTSILL